MGEGSIAPPLLALFTSSDTAAKSGPDVFPLINDVPVAAVTTLQRALSVW